MNPLAFTNLMVLYLAAATQSTPTTSPTDAVSMTSCHSMTHRDSQGSQISSKKRYHFWDRFRGLIHAVIISSVLRSSPSRSDSFLCSGTTRNVVLEFVTFAGTILLEASQMTQGIPYVECLAKAIEYVAKASKVRSHFLLRIKILIFPNTYRSYRRLKQRSKR